MKNLPALFSYRNNISPVHKIPAIIKLLLLSVVAFRAFATNIYGLVFYLLLGSVFFFLAKTPFASLKRLKFIFLMGFFMTLISLCEMNFAAVKNDLLYILRFFVTALISLIVFETTSKLQILDCLSSIENAVCKVIPPFRKLKIALILSVAITFIPEIFSCWNKVGMAAASRTPLNKKGKRAAGIKILTVRLEAFFLNMLQYAEEVRRAVNNRM